MIFAGFSSGKGDSLEVLAAFEWTEELRLLDRFLHLGLHPLPHHRLNPNLNISGVPVGRDH